MTKARRRIWIPHLLHLEGAFSLAQLCSPSQRRRKTLCRLWFQQMLWVHPSTLCKGTISFTLPISGASSPRHVFELRKIQKNKKLGRNLVQYWMVLGQIVENVGKRDGHYMDHRTETLHKNCTVLLARRSRPFGVAAQRCSLFRPVLGLQRTLEAPQVLPPLLESAATEYNRMQPMDHGVAFCVFRNQGQIERYVRDVSDCISKRFCSEQCYCSFESLASQRWSRL